jgi:DNA-binding response OmpR family regulator
MEPHLAIIEDDTDTRDALTEFLTEEGFRISGFGTAEEALAWLSLGARPQAVLSDLRLPGIGGFGFLHRLREMLSIRDLPVLFMSADTKDLDLSAELGCEHIAKPFTPSSLLAKIQAIVPGWGRRRALIGLD